ncbi:MAG: hypothetical protein JSR67_11240 [Proteobacteria bacterium]|nr:hypothetical protein [Pseudomonadota bacterium]
MTFSDETVMAYVDGELDEADRAAVEAAMRDNADLARRVERQRALRTRLQDHFKPVLSEPIPPRLLDALAARGAPRPSGSIVALRPRARAHWSWREWGAMAASLVAGALIAPFIWRGAGSSEVELQQGQLLAAGTLGTALTRQLASEPSAGAAIQIGISFPSRTDSYCRTFVLRQHDSLAGLACHESEGWRIMALGAVARPGTAGPYRQAASEMPGGIAHAVDEMIAGQTLDAAAERAARARGWQR